jgi:hypothetical protein
MLEARVPQRLTDGRVHIGPGGTVTYSVRRGPLSVSVSHTALMIEAPVHASAEACRGDACYASCQPEAVVVAEVPLMLSPDYRFRATSVSLRFTRPCKVRALGGLLTVDLTPTLEAQLRPELQRVESEIDGQLPELATRIAAAWSELSATRELPLGGCFVLQPVGVVQGPFTPSADTLDARFAVLAYPELRASCGAPPSMVPLPLLQTDAALPEEGVVRLGMVTSLASVARAFEAAESRQASGKRFRVAHAEVTSQGSDVEAQLALTGDVCGEVGVAAHFDYSGDGQLIRLAGAELPPGERERINAAELEPAALTQALATAPRIRPLLSVQALRDAAPPLAAKLSQPALEVRAVVSSARAGGALARDEELVTFVEARGALWLKADAQALMTRNAPLPERVLR